jgi:HPt (histidine-containing phosphotransfer) domain-containing protein
MMQRDNVICVPLQALTCDDWDHHVSAARARPGLWWDTKESGLREAAVAFVAEIEGLAIRLEAERLAIADLKTIAHQIRGAAGIFLADTTAAAAAALEAAIGRADPHRPLEHALGQLTIAMRHDATRMRARLEMAPF